MKVNDALVDKLAHLSRLEFDQEETKEISQDLQKMIGFIDKLNELDTRGVEPLLHMSENVHILREDVVSGMLSRADALRNAPAEDGAFFKVPKVIKNP